MNDRQKSKFNMLQTILKICRKTVQMYVVGVYQVVSDEKIIAVDFLPQEYIKKIR
jgi:hypothetical protein